MRLAIGAGSVMASISSAAASHPARTRALRSDGDGSTQADQPVASLVFAQCQGAAATRLQAPGAALRSTNGCKANDAKSICFIAACS